MLEVDRAQGRLVVSCREIPGCRAADVVPFAVRDPRELDGIPANVMVDLTVVVDGEASYAEDVRLRPFRSTEPERVDAERLKLMEEILAGGPAVKPLASGEGVPDFSLIDQKGRTLVFSSLSTVTFDPLNDRPEVLEEYARTWKADADGWRFLTGPVAEVQRVCRMFGMDFWPDMGMITPRCGRPSSTGRDGSSRTSRATSSRPGSSGTWSSPCSTGRGASRGRTGRRPARSGAPAGLKAPEAFRPAS